jgi:pilus assembly protein Flp/PilA
VNDSGGATAIEYALIACLVSIVIVTSATAIGGSVKGMLERVAAAFE